ncbi:MAM domain-containing glycosylphosphatidylinositol anchor protein 2-like [Antedon mediterranea]|uniref:MAM domain-containing glycosylphosphatidylinositol anchor protein 2-like n=1 Tax=Antedon mediterranea TaxID=105859 RepID=UPI003AF89811
MALSKVVFLIGLLSCLTEINGQFDCTFENGFCSWQQLRDDVFDWTRLRGPSTTGTTGPSVDHTLGTSSGYYLYIEASSPRVLGDTARILGPSVTLNQGGVKCVRFWHHSYGSNIGTFNMYVSSDGAKANLGSPVFTFTGTQGDNWILGQVDIDEATYGGQFKVVFEGVVGNGINGDIALDDFQIFSGLCPQIVVTPAPSDSPSFAQCDFEDPQICNFVQDTTDDFDWTRASGGTDSSGTGPTYDHTYGTSKG